MATISKWTIDLQTNTASFRRGLKKSRGMAKGFGSGITKLLGGPLAKLTAVLGVAGGAAGFVFLIKKQFAALDVIAKTSDAIGIQTEELIGLQHAAELSGVGNETLTKSLIRMQRSIGDATDGLTTSIRAFDKLELNYRDLAKLSPDEQLKRIADAMGNVATQTERVAVAMQIFGRGGASLIPLLNEGSAGIEAMIEEVRALGGAFTRIDLGQVEAANNAMTRMKLLSAIAFRTIAVKLAPFVDALATKFFDMAKSGEGMGVKITNAFESITKGVAFLADIVLDLRIAWEGMKFTALTAIQFIRRGVQTTIRESLRLLNFFSVGLADLLSKIPQIGTSLAASVRAANQATQQTGGLMLLGTTGLIEEGQKQLDEMLAKFESLRGMNFGNRVQKFFDDIRAKALAAAAAIAAASGKRQQPGPVTPDITGGPGTFQQVVRSRLFLGGAAKPGRELVPVKADPQELSLLGAILAALDRILTPKAA